jgi:hypothetical protein
VNIQCMCLRRILLCSILHVQQAKNKTGALEEKVAVATRIVKLKETRGPCGMFVVCATFAQRCGVHSGLDAQTSIWMSVHLSIQYNQSASPLEYTSTGTTRASNCPSSRGLPMTVQGLC